MFQHLDGDDQNAVQFGTDYFELRGVEYQLGHSGFIDFAGRYWPCCFVITEAENKITATAMMGAVKLIIKSVGGKKITCLNDASVALDSAINDLNLTLQRCFAHVVRLPSTKKYNSRHGTRGSLARYLLKAMKFTHNAMTKVRRCIPSLQ